MSNVLELFQDRESESDSLKIQVYKRLRTYLMIGRFVPGEKIIIDRLAKELGTSPTPVREALLMLVQDKALEMKASSSCRVPELSASRYEEIRKIRIELQCLAAREAMKHLDPEETAVMMEETHEKFLDAENRRDIEALLTYNKQFSMILTLQSQMPILISMIETLWMQVGPVINLFFQDTKRTFVGPHPHIIMIAGVRRNSPDTVCQTITDLLMESGDFILAHLKERELQIASGNRPIRRKKQEG